MGVKKEYYLDSIDENIIDMLEENARTTFTSMARETKISRQAVVARIKAMERAGIIKGYKTIVDRSQVGG